MAVAIELALAALGPAALVNGRLVDAIVLLAATGGAQAFQRHGHRSALVVAFAATGACVAWSCYALVLTYLPNELAQTDRIGALDITLVVAKLVVGALLTAVLLRTTRTDAAAAEDEAQTAEAVVQNALS